MYVVIRTWENAAALADAIQQNQQEVTDILKGVSGFQAYYATRNADTLTTITVCDSRAGTQESTKLASEWVKQHVTGVSLGTPKITEGETFLQI